MHMKMLPLVAAATAMTLAFAIGRASADQPHMESALSSLQAAKAELNKAAENKGGHRVKALQDVEDAIREVKAGIEFDRRH